MNKEYKSNYLFSSWSSLNHYLIYQVNIFMEINALHENILDFHDYTTDGGMTLLKFSNDSSKFLAETPMLGNIF